MGTAAELKLRTGQKVTTVEATARGNNKTVEGLPLVPDDSWVKAEAETGAPVRYEVEEVEVTQLLTYGILVEVVATTKPDSRVGKKRAIHPEFSNFLGGPEDHTRQELDRAGVQVLLWDAPPRVVRERKIAVKVPVRGRP